MSKHSVVHETFRIERAYKQAPARVFAAFSDPAKKRRWFAEGEGWQIDAWEVNFRVGGVESSRFRFQNGPEITNETLYTDIVPDARIIIAYTMTVGGKRISSSLATTELIASGSGTKLIYTEQGAFLDGLDGAKQRHEGCIEMLEKLARELDAHG